MTSTMPASSISTPLPVHVSLHPRSGHPFSIHPPPSPPPSPSSSSRSLHLFFFPFTAQNFPQDSSYVHAYTHPQGRRERERGARAPPSPPAPGNIKLNKRSIFCSLFLTRLELRYFATLSLHPTPPNVLLRPTPGSTPLRSIHLSSPPFFFSFIFFSLSLPLSSFAPSASPPSLTFPGNRYLLLFFPPTRFAGLFHPYPRASAARPPPHPILLLLSPPPFHVSLFVSPSRAVRRNEPRRGEALYQSRVRLAWFIFYFGRGPNCKINTSS